MSAPPNPEPSRVLGVCSDRDITHLLKSVLTERGLAFEAVDSAAAAWNVLREGAIDAVVLDLVLPDTDGRKLLMRLRERRDTARIPVVVLSARDESAIKSECFALGADGFFGKPFDPDALGSFVKAQVRKAGPGEAEGANDPITGLLNRAALVEAFSSLDGEGDVALALLEVDDFEEVTRRLGAGAQQQLSRIGRALGEAVTPPNSLGRWEGAAFVLLLPGASRDAARQAAEALLAHLLEAAAASGGGLAASAGVAWGRADQTLPELLEEARYRLFRARAAGGDRVDAEPAHDGDDRQVLVAEDDPMMATLLKTRLEREGFRVSVYGNGLQALEAAMASVPDLVILDVRMPGMDGFEVLAALRGESRADKLPVLMLTSMGREADLVRAFELGADDYVVKPFSPTELLARMRRLLHRSVRNP